MQDFRPNQPIPTFIQETTNSLRKVFGYIGGAIRQVETWETPTGIFLRTEGSRDFYISPDGQNILCSGKNNVLSNKLDHDLFFGPVLITSLAMRKTWCLHASAVMHGNHTIAFLGESGQGKSTLATYMNNNEGWELVADDILPVTVKDAGVQAWPRFPQLKLPQNQQPSMNHPEEISLDRIYLLSKVDKNIPPALELLTPNQAIRTWIGHTIGTRLFEQQLLQKHLNFCAEVAKKIPVYKLTYPHRKEMLPVIKDLLEAVC